jgi:hypothetical protein
MVAPTNSRAGVSEAIGRQLDFYTVRSLLDFTPGVAGSESQTRLNALIETIGIRAQPVIVNVDPVNVETDPVDLPDGVGDVNVYTLKFAVEHANAWEGATPSLLDSLMGAQGFTAGNISVTYHVNL